MTAAGRFFAVSAALTLTFAASACSRFAREPATPEPDTLVSISLVREMAVAVKGRVILDGIILAPDALAEMDPNEVVMAEIVRGGHCRSTDPDACAVLLLVSCKSWRAARGRGAQCPWRVPNTRAGATDSSARPRPEVNFEVQH